MSNEITRAFSALVCGDDPLPRYTCCSRSRPTDIGSPSSQPSEPMLEEHTSINGTTTFSPEPSPFRVFRFVGIITRAVDRSPITAA
jgi:hypothetical protein